VALVVGACHGGSDPVTAPAPAPAPDPAQRAATAVAALSDTDLVGQVLIPSVDLGTSPATAAALVARYHLGGVIIMGDPGPGDPAQQVRELTGSLQQASHGLGSTLSRDTDMLVGTDQEYGWVTRIRSGMVQLPSAMTFGAAGRPDLTEAAWKAAGTELAALGVNVDFAPDADVTGSADNTVIGSRSYGSTPQTVSTQVAAAVRGLQSAGVAATLKHFPGHGHTSVDSHAALPVLNQSLAALTSGDLPPFQAGIGAGSWMIMSGHLDVTSVDPGLPASFSGKVLGPLLRGQLGFGGVVITDALNMAPAMAWPPGEAALRALIAGNDLLLMPPDVGAAQQALLDALKSGRLPRARLVDAATRAATLRYRLASFARPAPSAVNAPGHWDAAAAVAAAAVTVLRGDCAGPVAASAGKSASAGPVAAPAGKSASAGPLVTGPVRVTASADRGQQAAWLADELRRQGIQTVTGSGGSQIHLVGYGDGPGDLAPGAAVTVSMDTPYILSASNSPVLVATYTSTEAAMRALARVLAGKANAVGRSPVAVPGLPASACSG
jgi:beta-N-acetylhexosaminidase